MSLRSRSPTDGIGAASSLSSSVAIRSPDRWPTSDDRAWIPASVAASTPKPERRGQADRPDHPQRILLEPGPRVADGAQDAGRGVGAAAVRVHEDRALAVGRPAGVAPQAIALTVKSRRARSDSMVSPNSTRCGRRKSA